jgi:hypothetical protein
MRRLREAPGGAMSGTREPNNGMMWTIVSVVHHRCDLRTGLYYAFYFFDAIDEHVNMKKETPILERLVLVCNRLARSQIASLQIL